MKKIKNLLYGLPFLLLACNNEANDPVETADSTNDARDARADTTGTYRVDSETSDFLVKAADAGMAEVKISGLAEQKGMNQRVKQMGAMLVKDHTAANDEVKRLAGQRNVSLPATVGDDKQKDFNDLSSKTGNAFDKAYVGHMIDAHKKAIDLFKNASEKVNDTDVRNFANNTLPKLQMHLDSLQVIEKIIK